MVGYAAGMVASLDAGIAAVAFVNGPGSPYLLARHAVALVRAGQQGTALPDPPELEYGNPMANSGTFYRDGDETSKALTFAPARGILVLHHRGEAIPLHPYDDDAFISDHPDWDRFVLGFERDSEENLVADNPRRRLVRRRRFGRAAGCQPTHRSGTHLPVTTAPQSLGHQLPDRPPPRRPPPDLP